VAGQPELDASVDAMSDEQNTGGAEVHGAAGFLRVTGFPGSFSAWGLECVRQILQAGGYASQVLPLDQAPQLADGATADTVGVMFGCGPLVADTGGVPSRTIVFLDAPARAFHERLAEGCDPVDAARMLTATLAPLGSLLREDGVLLVHRTPEMDPAAVQSEIARHISSALRLPPELTPACPLIDVSAPPPALLGQALALLRQTVTPMTNFVTSGVRDPIVWPLASFYSGDYPNELASPFIEVVGPPRVLYYGPYFHLPRGNWRADIQVIASGNMHDKMLAVDVYASTELARHDFKPAQGGLLQASLLFAVDRPQDRIEVRVWLLEGAIEGYLGLKQVLLHPA
jgi:hypothetical protein